jgi:hypothetical protein
MLGAIKQKGLNRIAKKNIQYQRGRIESVRVYPEQTQPSKLIYSKNRICESIPGTNTAK